MARKGLAGEGLRSADRGGARRRALRAKGNSKCKGPGAGTSSENLKVSELRVMGGEHS